MQRGTPTCVPVPTVTGGEVDTLCRQGLPRGCLVPAARPRPCYDVLLVHYPAADDGNQPASDATRDRLALKQPRYVCVRRAAHEAQNKRI